MLTFEERILGDPNPFPPGIYFTICSYTTYPYSRGHVVSLCLSLPCIACITKRDIY